MENAPTVKRIVIFEEETFEEKGRKLEKSVRRVAVAAVLSNPYAGKYVSDLSALVPFSEQLGKRLGKIVVDRLGGMEKVDTYGKAGVVGEDGELDHIAVILHAKLAAGYREYVGSMDTAKEFIQSTEVIGPMGTPLYIPMRYKHKYDSNYIDTVRVSIPDAPKRDEMVVAIAGGSGPRPLSRMPPTP
jgi:hypothetical protein